MTDSNSLIQIDVSPAPAGTRITVPPMPLRDVPASNSDYRRALSRRLDGTNRRTPPAENSSRDLRGAATQYAPRSPAEDQREASTDNLGASRSSSAQQQAPGRNQPTGDSDEAGTNEPNTAPTNDRLPPQSETETQTGDAPNTAFQHVLQSQSLPLPPAGIEILLSDLPDKSAGDFPSEPIDVGSLIAPAGLVQTFRDESQNVTNSLVNELSTGSELAQFIGTGATGSQPGHTSAVSSDVLSDNQQQPGGTEIAFLNVEIHPPELTAIGEADLTGDPETVRSQQSSETPFSEAETLDIQPSTFDVGTRLPRGKMLDARNGDSFPVDGLLEPVSATTAESPNPNAEPLVVSAAVETAGSTTKETIQISSGGTNTSGRHAETFVAQTDGTTNVGSQGLASTAPTHDSTAAPQTATRPEFHASEFVDRVADAVRIAQKDGQRLRIQLHPPQLGALRIDVSIRGGTLSAHLEVQTSAAQQAILENMSLLREVLMQNGTTIDRIEVQLVDPTREDAQAELSDQQDPDFQDQQPDQDQQQDSPEESEEHADADTPPHRILEIDQLDIQV